jgi:hypothetical protein
MNHIHNDLLKELNFLGAKVETSPMSFFSNCDSFKTLNIKSNENQISVGLIS